MRKILRFVACAMLLLQPLGALAGDPINNLEDVRIGVKLNGTQPTLAEVQSAIIKASIRYRTSRELEFNELKQTIHGNYNKRVALLARDINQQITALPASTTP